VGFLEIQDKFLYRELHPILRAVGIIEKVYHCQKGFAVYPTQAADLLYAFVTYPQGDSKPAEHVEQTVVGGNEGLHLVPCCKYSLIPVFHMFVLNFLQMQRRPPWRDGLLLKNNKNGFTSIFTYAKIATVLQAPNT
jgi:hypothetical protein